jgi:DNA-binding transcriptional LysR family regulator
MSKIVDWDRHIGRRIQLRDLHVFFAVVQAGSLAKAAAQLNVSQPAVSQFISNMEHALAVKLFDRSSRGVIPTSYGHVLLARARAAFDELKQGIQEIEFLSEPHSGEVKFGCPEGLAPILPPIIKEFSRRYPKIILDIYEEEIATFASKLRRRNIDFVLQRLHGKPRADDPTLADLHVETLFEDDLIIAVGKRNPLARRNDLDLAELLDEPWILANPPSWNHRVLSEACRLRRLRMPNVVLSTFSTHIRASMVTSGHFVTTFPRSVARFYAERFELKILNIALPQPPWPVATLTLKNRTMAPAVQLFLDHIRETMMTQYGRPFARNDRLSRPRRR